MLHALKTHKQAPCHLSVACARLMSMHATCPALRIDSRSVDVALPPFVKPFVMPSHRMLPVRAQHASRTGSHVAGGPCVAVGRPLHVRLRGGTCACHPAGSQSHPGAQGNIVHYYGIVSQ